MDPNPTPETWSQTSTPIQAQNSRSKPFIQSMINFKSQQAKAELKQTPINFQARSKDKPNKQATHSINNPNPNPSKVNANTNGSKLQAYSKKQAMHSINNLIPKPREVPVASSIQTQTWPPQSDPRNTHTIIPKSNPTTKSTSKPSHLTNNPVPHPSKLNPNKKEPLLLHCNTS